MELYSEILEIAEKIYKNPELGFKEFKTSLLIKEYLLRYKADLEIIEFAKTGIKFNLGEEKDINLAIVVELDAVYAPTHIYADKSSGVAHNCGHYSQVAIALSLFRRLIEENRYRELDFNIGFVFVPAEEYLDLEYRKRLKESGEIAYFSGKSEAMREGIFDEYDLAIAIHSMGGEFDKRGIEIDCDLAGFMYKYYTFKGKSSHAGFAPQFGVNAYSISTLFNNAVALYRQQIDERHSVRLNPVVMETDMGVNIIPNRIKIGTDIRSHSIEYSLELANRLDIIAKSCSTALGGDVEIESEVGYLPFTQSRYLSSFVKTAFEKFKEIELCVEGNRVSASGDIGDLSYMLPAIQIGYNGFSGTIHGDDFIHSDSEYIFSIFPKFLLEVLKEMSGKIDKTKLYKCSYAEYKDLIERIGGINES